MVAISHVSSQNTPRAYQDDFYPWNLHRVPRTVQIGKIDVPHPALHSAIFVVHGMGDQQWTETSATLRLGLEDALVHIRKWQDHWLPIQERNADRVPPPFAFDGYWADYADLEKTFPEDWALFNDRERKFFGFVWAWRAYSVIRTGTWILCQTIRLVDPRRIHDLRFAWFVYLPLPFLTLLALVVSLIKAPRILTRVVADVRMYAEPRGMAEQAIVQRIDKRVGEALLRLIGLDWNFRPLLPEEMVHCSGEPFVFDRVIWVSHSLGTVISYNVLSDLLARADEIDAGNDEIQKNGTAKFRLALRRFITLGSPLDKFAYLYPNALRPWKKGNHKGFLQGGEFFSEDVNKKGYVPNPEETEWWINFYDAFDPVSGPLNNKLICGEFPPANIRSNSSFESILPGLAHIAYWDAGT